MAKRFTDTGIWNKAWFRRLDPQDKTAMFYVLSNCDAVGVWDADTEAAEFFIGAAVEWDGLIGRTNGNLERLPNGKIFVVDFCEFQYGDLSPDCKPHQAYIRLLEKHGLKNRIMKGYPKGIHTLEEKEKEKEKEKSSARAEKKTSASPTPFDRFWEKYPRKIAKDKARQSWDRDGLDPHVDRVIDAVAKHAEQPQWTKDDGQFIPHPTTWLNQKRYNDKLDIEVRPAHRETKPPFDPSKRVVLP